MTIRTEQRTVYVTSTGLEFPTLKEAEIEEHLQAMVIVLEDIDVYWRETCASDVAQKLFDAGYTIVFKDKEAT